MPETKIFNNRLRRAVQAGAIVAAVGGGYVLREMKSVDAQGDGVPVTKVPVVQTAATRDAASIQGAFAEVAAAVEPAVVTIVTEGTKIPSVKTPGNRQRLRPFGGSDQGNGADPFGGDLQEFFKQFGPDFGFNKQNFDPNSWQGRVMLQKFREVQSQRQGGGLGSGMIYRADGLILTNAHVVAGADTVNVTLSDGRKFEKARVLGRDTRTDIAVVKIPATGLPTVKFGDSSEPRVGDWAIAVGNPFGLDHTLTVGVISAKSRELALAQDTRTDYLQTDASINPGNSGGPLLDIYGRVIGVNNAIYSESGGNQGIGFAIPINTAKRVAEILAKEGKVRRGYLGVKISNVEDRGAAFGLDAGLKGVLIEEVSDPNAPGAKAGLQAGDVVTKFNDTPVAKSTELQRLVGDSPVGTEIKLTVLRGGQTKILTAKLEELKDGGATSPTAPDKAEPAQPEGTNFEQLGLRLRAGAKGIEIVDIKDDSPADNAGLQVGDVIDQVGQSPVKTVAELQNSVSAILNRQTGDSKKVALRVNRAGQTSFVIVTVG